MILVRVESKPPARTTPLSAADDPDALPGLDTPSDDEHVRAVLDRVQTVMAQDWPRREELRELAFMPSEWGDLVQYLTVREAPAAVTAPALRRAEALWGGLNSAAGISRRVVDPWISVSWSQRQVDSCVAEPGGGRVQKGCLVSSTSSGNVCRRV